MKLRKNDKIKVIAGKDKGKESVVERALPSKGKVYAKDVNIAKKHVKGQGIIDLLRPIEVSNVALVCPKCGKVTRVGFKVKDGKKVRICRKCQEEI